MTDRGKVHLAAYDIRSDSRRRKVFKTLSAYGVHRQRSLFEVRLESNQRKDLLEELDDLLEDDDQLLLARLCGHCERSGVYRISGEEYDVDIKTADPAGCVV